MLKRVFRRPVRARSPTRGGKGGSSARRSRLLASREVEDHLAATQLAWHEATPVGRSCLFVPFLVLFRALYRDVVWYTQIVAYSNSKLGGQIIIFGRLNSKLTPDGIVNPSHNKRGRNDVCQIV